MSEGGEKTTKEKLNIKVMAIKNLNITSSQLEKMQNVSSIEEMDSIVTEVNDSVLDQTWKTVKRMWLDERTDYIKDSLNQVKDLFQDFLDTSRVKAHIALHESALRVLQT